MERAILVGLNSPVFTREQTATDASLDELEALLETAGGICCAKMLQNRATPDPRTLLGEGKAAELAELVQHHDASMVVFDNDLTPSQNRALEQVTKVRVLDRSALIPAAGRAGPIQIPAAAACRHVDPSGAAGGRHRLPRPR